MKVALIRTDCHLARTIKKKEIGRGEIPLCRIPFVCRASGYPSVRTSDNMCGLISGDVQELR